MASDGSLGTWTLVRDEVYSEGIKEDQVLIAQEAFNHSGYVSTSLRLNPFDLVELKLVFTKICNDHNSTPSVEFDCVFTALPHPDLRQDSTTKTAPIALNKCWVQFICYFEDILKFKTRFELKHVSSNKKCDKILDSVVCTPVWSSAVFTKEEHKSSYISAATVLGLSLHSKIAITLKNKKVNLPAVGSNLDWSSDSFVRRLQGSSLGSGCLFAFVFRGTCNIFRCKHASGKVGKNTRFTVESPTLIPRRIFDSRSVKKITAECDEGRVFNEAKHMVDAHINNNATKLLSIGLQGAPGAGKSYILDALASCFYKQATETGRSEVLQLSASQIVSNWNDQDFRLLRLCLDYLSKNSSIIFLLDDADSLVLNSEGASNKDTEGEMLTENTTTNLSSIHRHGVQFLTELQNIQALRVVLIVAFSGSPKYSPLVRNHIINHVITIPAPSISQREHLLQEFTLTSGEDITMAAKLTSGYVARDLFRLCTHARTMYNQCDTLTALMNAMDYVKPSQLTDILVQSGVESATTQLRNQQNELDPWVDIGGLDEVRKKLEEAIQWPLLYPESLKRLGLHATRGVLLHGPSGCGKTLAVVSSIKKLKINFLSIKGPEMFSKYFGETERFIRSLFAKARKVSPCVIFIDELDSIASARNAGSGSEDAGGINERVVGQILTEMDGVGTTEGVLVVGCTNRIDLIDSALLRPGRFDTLISVDLPNLQHRTEILKIQSKKHHFEDDVDLHEIALKTTGFTSADLIALCREAAIAALRENILADTIGKRHFKDAFSQLAPSVQFSIAPSFVPPPQQGPLFSFT